MWTLYILRCRDGTYYTGITNHLKRRLDQHNGGRAARYTRGRGPVRIIYHEPCGSRSAAMIKEAKIKSLTRKGKEKFIENGVELHRKELLR